MGDFGSVARSGGISSIAILEILFVTVQLSQRWNVDNATSLFRHSEPGRAKRATVRNLASLFGKTIAVLATIAQDPSSLTLLRGTGECGVGMSNIAHGLLTTPPKISEICVCFSSALSVSLAVTPHLVHVVRILPGTVRPEQLLLKFEISESTNRRISETNCGRKFCR